MEKLLWGFSVITILAMSLVYMIQSTSVVTMMLGIIPLLMVSVFSVALWRARKKNQKDTNEDKKP